MLIGLTGKRQAGKDTIANALVADYGFQRVTLADPLKELLYDQNPTVWLHGGDLGWSTGGAADLADIIDAHGWDAAKQLPQIRGMLISTGRAITSRDQLFFVRLAFAKVDHIICRGGDAVVTDMRFDFELPALHEREGRLVRVERVSHVVASTDRSETEADGWAYDVVIRNDPPRTDPAYLANLVLEEIRNLAW